MLNLHAGIELQLSINIGGGHPVREQIMTFKDAHNSQKSAING